MAAGGAGLVRAAVLFTGCRTAAAVHGGWEEVHFFFISLETSLTDLS
jgi:hypothetical protein